jgi:Na+/phosphate symporter
MSKRALRAIIENENFMRKWRDEAPIDIDALYKITDENIKIANELFESIDCGLSPEHLHCDGEITKREAQAKFNRYMGAVNQLENMGYTVPDTCWEIETES